MSNSSCYVLGWGFFQNIPNWTYWIKPCVNIYYLVAPGLFCLQRMPGTIQRRIFLRARRFPVLRDVLSRHPRLPLCNVSQANLWALHHSHVQEIPPRVLRLQVGGDSTATVIELNFYNYFSASVWSSSTRERSRNKETSHIVTSALTDSLVRITLSFGSSEKSDRDMICSQVLFS